MTIVFVETRSGHKRAELWDGPLPRMGEWVEVGGEPRLRGRVTDVGYLLAGGRSTPNIVITLEVSG